MSKQSRNAPYKRPSRPRRKETPPGKHAHTAPRLIGYGILALAALLIAIGTLIS
jgi:hypothetical protein